MYTNPYFNQNYQQNYLPKQEVIRVNGKASVDSMQLPPTSSVLVMDTSAPLVWLCISDGLGKVTATPYVISEYKEKPPIDMQDIENRLAKIEKQLEEKSNVKPNAKKSKLTE